MARDLFRRAGDHHLVNVSADQHFSVAIGSRHRVVVAAVAHQRERADSRCSLLAGLIGSGGQRQEPSAVSHQPLADGLIVAT